MTPGPAGAPYERIIATFSVDRIPSAWLEQTEPGGRIVTPWNSAWCSGYGTLVLTTTPDGGGEGRFHDFASFMPMRELVPSATAPADNGGPPEPRHVTSSALSPWAVAGGNLNAEFHVGLTVPGACFAWDASGEHAPARLDVADDTGPSWATVDYDGQHAERFTVTQAGPRRLWDEITAAHTRWESLGRPSVDQYGLTVDTAGAQTDGTAPARRRPRQVRRRHRGCRPRRTRRHLRPPGPPLHRDRDRAFLTPVNRARVNGAAASYI
ncbi:hypothetical protein EW053_23965 [Streptomyces sp. IB2014 016-6]|nr:hypothetical protein EW053_23965 [Streptomyces sp. IB2014 016-6]